MSGVKYEKKRFYNSDVHIITVNLKEGAKIDLVPVDGLKTTSAIVSGAKAKYGINGGFFYNKEGVGEFIVNGQAKNLYSGAPNVSYVGITKDNKPVVNVIPNADNSVSELIDDNLKFAVFTSPMLVKSGKVFVNSKAEGTMSDIANSISPRTAFGYTATGEIKLVVVDGRSSYDRGMTLNELAQTLINIGVVNGANLDGGGSSAMISNGKLVNSPSDGKERSVANAIVVYEGVPVQTPSIQTIKTLLNGAPIQGNSTGIVANNTTHIIWPVLQVLNIPNTYLGNGLFNINGRKVQGVVYNGHTYLPWNQILPDKIVANKIDGGWNFVVKK